MSFVDTACVRCHYCSRRIPTRVLSRRVFSISSSTLSVVTECPMAVVTCNNWCNVSNKCVASSTIRRLQILPTIRMHGTRLAARTEDGEKERQRRRLRDALIRDGCALPVWGRHRRAAVGLQQGCSVRHVPDNQRKTGWCRRRIRYFRRRLLLLLQWRRCWLTQLARGVTGGMRHKHHSVRRRSTATTERRRSSTADRKAFVSVPIGGAPVINNVGGQVRAREAKCIEYSSSELFAIKHWLEFSGKTPAVTIGTTVFSASYNFIICLPVLWCSSVSTR